MNGSDASFFLIVRFIEVDEQVMQRNIVFTDLLEDLSYGKDRVICRPTTDEIGSRFRFKFRSIVLTFQMVIGHPYCEQDSLLPFLPLQVAVRFAKS